MATTTELEARITQLEATLREVEANQEDGRPLRSLIDRLFPADARTHLRAARKEQLLAMRSFLDHWIEKVDEDAETPRRRESISLD
ncbi:MAG TPA: hypothetical protein VIN69_07340 [Candidatus Limnocylindria bacterium]|jgi:hypothetical protein